MEQHRQALRLLTLNIWNRWGPWPARRQLLRQGLGELSADVVALQEVLRMGGQATPMFDQLAELADGSYPHSAYAPAWTIDADSGFTMGNGLLSRLPILETEHCLLPNPQQHETRSLLYALLDSPHGQLPIFVTHLDWQLELSHVRCQQLLFVVERMAEWLGRARQRPGAEVLPAVLAGDLNAEPDSDELRFLRGRHSLPTSDGAGRRGAYFNDCYAYCGGDERSGVTFARSNPYAAAEREPDRRIDYLLVGAPDRKGRGEPLSAWRCFDRGEGGVFPSDHYGVAAEIQLAPRAKPQF